MRRTSTVELVVVTLLLYACGPGVASGAPSGSGATSLVPSNSAEATNVAPSPASAPTEPSMSPSVPFIITSAAFADGDAIPKRFTCDDANVSPEIEWSGAPVGTGALALTVIDPDARDFIHWLIYDIPRSAKGSLPEGVGVASGPIPQGVNSSGRAAYMGPCPPSGVHHYVFTLYALDTALGLTTPPKRAELEAAMKGHIRATAILTGTYTR